MPTIATSFRTSGSAQRNMRVQNTSVFRNTSTARVFLIVLLCGMGNCIEAMPWLQHNANHDYDPLTPRDLLPVITTKPLHFEVTAGANITFPCDIENLADKSVTWRRGEEILWLLQKRSEGTMRQQVDRDDRIHIQGTTLELLQVRQQDQNNYTCEVSSSRPSAVTHHLTVKVPPSIEATNGHTVITERVGDPATLACTASGQPTPTITWSKKNGVLPRGVPKTGGETLTVHSTKKEDAGIYICTASNSVGADAQAYVELLVMHAPEIEAEPQLVYGGVGYDAALACRVQAYPRASVKWYLYGAPVDPMRLKFSIKSNMKHLLRFDRVLKEDFGIYTCNASNYMGNDSAVVELTGRPRPVRIVSTPDSEYDTTYKLVWEVESYARILNFILSYRNLTDGEDAWLNLTVPGTSSHSVYHSQSHTLEGLESGAEYAVKVWARNEFGISEPSKVFQFQTLDITGSSGAVDDEEPPENQEQDDQGQRKSKEEVEEEEEEEGEVVEEEKEKKEIVETEDEEELKKHSKGKELEKKRNSTGTKGAPDDDAKSSVGEDGMITPQVLNDMGTQNDAVTPRETTTGAEAAKLDEASGTVGIMLTPREKRAQMAALVTAISLSTFFW